MSEEIQRESGVMDWASSVVKSVVSRGYLGGELDAAFRQGANELGAALKAFPDSIQIDEPGAAFNPLYRDRDGDTPAVTHGGDIEAPARVSPAEIADNARPRSTVHGNTQDLPSPSDIANDPTPHMPASDQGSVHGLDQGHDMGRGM